MEEDVVRVWEPLPEPGPEVTRLTDRRGHVWSRRRGGIPRTHSLWDETDCDGKPGQRGALTFREIFAFYAPLTDATPTQTGGDET
jgi:hypothetical protein